MSSSRTAVLLMLTGGLVTPLVGQQPWRPYQFKGTERFEYEVEFTNRGETQAGHYRLDFSQENGQTWAEIDGQVGDMTCSGRQPVRQGMGAEQAIAMQCMTMVPVMGALFTPVWAMLMGQSWQLGSRWSMGSGDQGVSFEVTEECEFAGVTGLLATITAQGNRMESCVSTDVALPLSMIMHQEDVDISIRLVGYRP